MSTPSLLPILDVERRFRDAERVGRPEWLWFEVPEQRWAEAAASIEGVLREVLAGGRSECRLIDDPVALSIACYTSGTGPLLGSWIEQGKLVTTPSNEEVLRIHLAHNRVRMARLTERAREAAEMLSRGGVTPIVMKGMCTAHTYFDEPGQRISADIDLLIPPGKLADAQAILADLGYEPQLGGFGQRTWKMPDVAAIPVTLTYVHRDDPWSIDLHDRAKRKFAGGALMADLDLLVATTSLEPWKVSATAVVFSPPLLLAHLLVHASSYFDSLTLQRQYEICLVIKRDEDVAEFNWPAFTALCDRTRLWTFMYPAMLCAQRLSPGIIPEPILQRARNAAPPGVRNLIDVHSAASAHRVGRWSWAEKFMWADGIFPRARQFFDDLRFQDHMSLAEISRRALLRINRQIALLQSKFRAPQEASVETLRDDAGS
ncbi:nucleotidyltransferase family protein [Sphingomonas sp. JC676]|uniref:nucleotidyltransferase family protein n=1 Tax=Sphingomonas sp. JC676 TaxID=2768065 RepID=UPI0016577D29|nr:nucleotidyltransferase family protein [Sphingomonas sp. JC676]MBC9030962.1 nucleotidyltransferase family protein [Sphingomonas sp. JC676]